MFLVDIEIEVEVEDMNVQIYTLKKNFDCQKAERWFKERRIKYQLIDLAKMSLSPREFDSVKAQVGLQAMIDTQSKAYQESTLRFIRGEELIKEELIAHPAFFRAPIVRNGRQATVGYCPEIWSAWE